MALNFWSFCFYLRNACKCRPVTACRFSGYCESNPGFPCILVWQIILVVNLIKFRTNKETSSEWVDLSISWKDRLQEKCIVSPDIKRSKGKAVASDLPAFTPCLWIWLFLPLMPWVLLPPSFANTEPTFLSIPMWTEALSICLRVSIVMKRYHDHGSSYKGKHLIGACL